MTPSLKMFEPQRRYGHLCLVKRPMSYVPHIEVVAFVCALEKMIGILRCYDPQSMEGRFSSYVRGIPRDGDRITFVQMYDSMVKTMSADICCCKFIPSRLIILARN